MQLSFVEETISKEVFLALNEGFRGFNNEAGRWELISDPGFRRVDFANNIYVYFAWWNLAPEDRRPSVHVCLVQWQEKSFRFYFHIFYLPENDKFYGDMRDTCWTVFKIELLEGWGSDKLQNIELLQSMIVQLGRVFKNTGRGVFINKSTVKFVEHRFESRPTVLLGE